MPKNLKWLPSLRDPGHMRLWRIGYALAVCFAAAVAVLTLLWWVAQVLLHHPALSRSHVISVHDTVGVAQLVFASVAGAGALVALVVAYRRQRVAEDAASYERTRILNERFTAIATQLGDAEPAVRLAGVHAMAGLADDWRENRQTCVDVLCAYLRLPYEPDPGPDAPAAERLGFRGNREVRHTVIRVITAHLQDDAAVSWQGLEFDFTGVVFDGGDFSGAVFSGGGVSFDNAQFSGSEVDLYFTAAQFSGALVTFRGAQFSAGEVSFYGAKFSGGTVIFAATKFSGGEVSFEGAQFCGALVGFNTAQFSGALVNFSDGRFSSGEVLFYETQFSQGEVHFQSARFSGAEVNFYGTQFSGGDISFYGAQFSGGQINFIGAQFSGGEVLFRSAQFSGGEVNFEDARFSGSEVVFTDPSDWSHPPKTDWDGALPAGVTLPPVTGQESQ